ncbi:MAG: T4 RnlA family RNA ligase [Saprospiraceae bacterium]|nr:T4 RnlA family RNA ligase [Saprospiraceae bacterium]
MINKTLLQEMIENDYVNVNKHPTHDLFIYNYTPKAQYDRVWNEVTLMCRGLILDGQNNIVARPFAKFFNLGEMENQVIPNEPFEVFDKLDGSLGILYWLENEAFIATRGSFVSDQAVVANRILQSKYADILRGGLDKSKTYLFEIIYPENRIVVDYGGLEDLILIAIIDNETGADLPLESMGFPMVTRFDGIKDISTLKTLEEANREGFVIKYKNGLRYKVKFEEYLRIHRIVTQVSNINIWEYLMTEMPFDEILDRVPDEFYDWVKATSADLQAQFAAIEAQCQADFKVFDTRKEAAFYFQTCAYPSVLFKMLDGKSYKEVIWRLIRPSFQKPFSQKMKEEI